MDTPKPPRKPVKPVGRRDLDALADSLTDRTYPTDPPAGSSGEGWYTVDSPREMLQVVARILVEIAVGIRTINRTLRHRLPRQERPTPPLPRGMRS